MTINSYLPIVNRVVWIDVVSPVQWISAWLLTAVSLMSNPRVSGIPGVSISGSSYTP